MLAQGGPVKIMSRVDTVKKLKEPKMGEKRDVYVEKLKSKIDEWNSDIDKLQAKADQLGAGAQAELQKHIAELKAKRGELQEKMGAVQKAGGEAWEDMKSGANSALEALGKAVQAAKSRFK
jgi:predicted  nucleic acid-binding Zn-ribbon protein